LRRVDRLLLLLLLADELADDDVDELDCGSGDGCRGFFSDRFSLLP
jgi:hypothetical protein